MDLAQQFGVVRRWLPLLVLGVVLAAVPAYLYASRQAAVYEVSTTVLPEQFLPSSNPDYNSFAIARLIGLSNTWALLADTPAVLTASAQRAGLNDSASELAKRVTAAADLNTGALTVSARAGTVAEAVALANAVADVIQEQSSPSGNNSPQLIADVEAARKRMLDTEAQYRAQLAGPGRLTLAQQDALASTQTLLNELRATYDSLAASVQRPTKGLAVVAEARAEDARMIAPRTVYYTILAVVAGLLVAAGLAFILEYRDDRIKGPTGVGEATGLPTLAAVGKRRRFSRSSEKTRLPTLLDPGSNVAEAYRSLRANVGLASADEPPRTIAVVSAIASEGKTIAAANLAVAYAQAGRRVVLVDADLRRPAIHQLFHLDNLQGLTSLLRNPDAPIANVANIVDQQENLKVLTTGPLPSDPAALLGSDSMRRLTERLLAQADVLIFDSAPLQVAVDAVVLASHVDAALLVVDATRSHRRSVVQAMETLTGARVNVIGAVLYSAARGKYPDHRAYAKGATGAVTNAVDRADSA